MFLSSDNPEALNSYGYLTDSLLISFFVFNWSIVFPIKIYDILHWIKEKCSKKKDEGNTSNVRTLYKSKTKDAFVHKQIETQRLPDEINKSKIYILRYSEKINEI